MGRERKRRWRVKRNLKWEIGELKGEEVECREVENQAPFGILPTERNIKLNLK